MIRTRRTDADLIVRRTRRASGQLEILRGSQEKCIGLGTFEARCRFPIETEARMWENVLRAAARGL